MMWEGEITCFKKTIEFLKKYDLNDSKGLTGEEYYLCAAIQYSKTRVCQLIMKKLIIKTLEF